MSSLTAAIIVTTVTGRWRVEYDGENRPVRWTREDDGKTVSMGYDHMGRRRTKDGQRFYYDGYLQVASERTVSNEVMRQHFVWDPTEPVATRPLAWVGAGGVACGGVRVRRRRARQDCLRIRLLRRRDDALGTEGDCRLDGAKGEVRLWYNMRRKP